MSESQTKQQKRMITRLRPAWNGLAKIIWLGSVLGVIFYPTSSSMLSFCSVVVFLLLTPIVLVDAFAGMAYVPDPPRVSSAVVWQMMRVGLSAIGLIMAVMAFSEILNTTNLGGAIRLACLAMVPVFWANAGQLPIWRNTAGAA